MALPTVTLGRAKAPGTHVVLTPDPMNWVAACVAPTVADIAANLLKPSLITRAGQNLVLVQFGCVSARACLRYVTGGAAVTVNPVIQLVGFDGNGVPALLFDGASTPASQWTLTATTATDLQGADGYSYTPSIVVDCRNCVSMMALIVTALAGGGANAAIMLQGQ